jgi:hypothetical protein
LNATEADARQEAEIRRETGGAGGGYAPPGEKPPLVPYAVAIAASNGLFAAGLALARRQGRELPERPALGDIALVGVAGHKLSRLIAKDKVTSPLRAPFTELEGSGGAAELEERARGGEVRRTIGQLLVCPYCLDLWAVAGFSLGLLYAPRTTRFVASVFAAQTTSDFLQVAYRTAQRKGLEA